MLRGGCKASERRRHLIDRLSWQQDQALSSSIYLLREMGPTAFLLREEEPENRDFRMFHFGFLLLDIRVLLKKFRLPRNHESALQLGLVEREINDLLQGIHRVQTPQREMNNENAQIEEDGYIKQKEIGSDDICSICQEVLLEKKLPVTFCRFGCGNSVHIKCMKILANYQDVTLNSSMLKCPLCRKDFGPLNLILEEFKNSNKLVTAAEKERLDKHLGIPCNNCQQFPLEGKCYKCTKCIEYHLCQDCFDSCCHLSHSFMFREFHRKCIDSWLLHKCNSCPIDGQVIYNPLIWKDRAVNGYVHHSVSNTDITHLPKQEDPELFIPGTGLVLKQNKPGILPILPQSNSEKLNTPQSPNDTYQNITIDNLYSFKLDDSNSRKSIYECKINQHFPSYLQDLPTGSFGKTSSQTFFPSIDHKNIIHPTEMKNPCINKKHHTSQSQKMNKTCKGTNHNSKKILGNKVREDNTRSNTLLPDLSLIVNWGTTKLSLSKRYNNCMGKIRPKCSHLSRRPISHPLNAKSPELSLILEGVHL
ncbi:hypothetical protein G4228_018522 [Cervus hanglu yarkandensis]|nr:hypothetical protein G4228_018522 [Cervus hanglu yarkandensis]